MPDLKSLLPNIVGNSEHHARWLNTFSYLEYIGFRKIVKSQHSSLMDFETLSHAVEEGRHALLLKRLAVNTGGVRFNHYTPETMLCFEHAETYFQSLDSFCEDQMKDMSDILRSRITYLYVTWLVEIRALSVYESYQSALKAIGTKSQLSGLLAEEDRHLAAVERELRSVDPLFESRSLQFQQIEDRLYQSYLTAISSELMPKVVHA